MIIGHFPSCSTFRYDMIEFRIKIRSMGGFSLGPGEKKTIQTWMKMSKSRSPLHSYYIKEGEKSLFKVVNEGYIAHNFRGRVEIELMNPLDTSLVIGDTYVIAYLLVSPFSLS